MITEELQVTTRMPRALRAGTRLRVGQVIDCVGGGSTGHVYRVIDDMGTHLAVREYFPPEIAMRVDGMVRPQERCDAAFQAGLKLFDEDGWQLAAQDHPGLLKVQQVWTENGTSYLSMPWCEGHTLKEIVRSSPMPPSQAQLGNWLRAMADALTLVHRRRGLHGNLSPGQVVLLDSGRLLVMEFGRARRVVTRDPREIERDPFAALECGTDPRCGPSGPWTDVYALAAMLFFVLRGRAPQSAVRRAAFDAQEPLTLMAGADYTEQFLSGIDAGLVLRPRARPQSLPEFLAGMGLRERRARQRATGESLLGNLPVADAAPPRDEVIDLPLDIEPEAPVEAAAEVHLQTPADAPVEAPAEPPIAAAPDPGLAPATVAHAAAMPEPAPDHAPAAPAAPATAPVAAAALEPAPAPVVAAPPSTQEATAAPVSAPVATPTAASKETSVEPQPQPQPNARPKTPTPPRAAKAAPTTPVSARSEQAEPVPSAQPAAPVAADQPVLTEIVEPPGPARAAEAPAKPAVPPPVQADRADRRAAPSVARDRARPAQAERRAPRPSAPATAPAPVPEPAPWPESAWPVSEAEASAAVAGYAKLHRRTQRRSGSAGAWAGLAGAAGMAVLLGVWWLQGGPGRPSSSAQVAASQAAPAAEASRAAQVVPPPSAALAAAEAGASSPIPDPLEPTAAGPSASQPVDAAVQPAPAASPEEPAAANVRDPVGPEAAAPAASVEPAAPAVPALQEAPRSSNARVPAPAPARASPKPRAVPTRQPADEVPAASPSTSDSAADTADPSSRCPDLLARQYTGRPLSAAEREQLRAHCR